MTESYDFYKKSAKTLAYIVLAMLLARFTNGLFCFVLVMIGVVGAFSNKTGLAICIFALLSVFIGTNPYILPKGSAAWNYSLRFGMLAISVSLALGGVRRVGSHRMPFIGLIPFLGVAIISSISGYLPGVSLAKILNYFLFMLGVWLGTQNLQKYPKDLEMIRSFFFASAVFFVLGSVALLLFPSISYMDTMSLTRSVGAEEAEAIFREAVASGGKSLFCGMFNHSQTLGTLIPEIMLLMLCDMLFIEKRARMPHLIIIFASLPLLFMSRSRVAFTATAAGLMIIYFYAVNAVGVERRIKQQLKNGMFMFLAMLVAGAIVMEIRSDTMSKWLRKTNDVEADDRSLVDAMTSSRMGLIEESMEDFRMNPAFGMGFQVSRWNAYYLKDAKGLILTAPIEKGVLPVMVLGETGVIGFIFFIVFLITFFVTAAQRNLHVTITLFCVILTTNLGEAEFFSPGGTGSFQWIFTVVGGFIIDTHLLYERNESRRRLEYGW